MVTVPKSLKIFYRIIPVDIYVPNPTRCFNCQTLGHHESNCPVDYASVCENVAQVVLIMWKSDAQTQLNVLTVASTTCLGPLNARCGKKKKKISKLKLQEI